MKSVSSGPLRNWLVPLAVFLVFCLLSAYLWRLHGRSTQLENRTEKFRTMRKKYVKLQAQAQARSSGDSDTVHDPLSYIESKTRGYSVDEISPINPADQTRRKYRLVLRTVPVTVPFKIFKSISEEQVMRVQRFRLERVSRNIKEFDSYFVVKQ